VTTTCITRSEEETHAVARNLAARLRPGAIVLLAGNLGAGKTAFARGLAAGLGIDPHEVSSPTFTLIHEYHGGRLPLYHADLYRLSGAATDDLGLEQSGMDGVLAIEWPDRLTHAPPDAIEVSIDVVEGQTRRIEIRNDPEDPVTPSGSSALPS
jgi:tRNA threonylcarbamoyladenosine biosynthesis protein TsaE